MPLKSSFSSSSLFFVPSGGTSSVPSTPNKNRMSMMLGIIRSSSKKQLLADDLRTGLSSSPSSGSLFSNMGSSSSPRKLFSKIFSKGGDSSGITNSGKVVLNTLTPLTPCNTTCSSPDFGDDDDDSSSFFFRPRAREKEEVVVVVVAVLQRKRKFDDSFDEYWGEEGVDQDSFLDFRSEAEDEEEEEREEGAEIEQRKIRKVMIF